jgi:hypothetical protein
MDVMLEVSKSDCLFVVGGMFHVTSRLFVASALVNKEGAGPVLKHWSGSLVPFALMLQQ